MKFSVQACVFALILAVAVLIAVAFGVNHSEIVRWSAMPMVLFWFGWLLTLFMDLEPTKVSRVVATLGLVLLIEHVLIAFGLAHAWSHQAAFEHTETVSGFGFGIWVNYAFVLHWTIDVAWQWLHIRSYQRRPCWLAFGVQGFYAFIMFNATIVCVWHQPDPLAL